MDSRAFDMNSYTRRKQYGFVFLLSFFLAAAFFLPYIIQDRGYFFYLGDFNCQQIPFNIMANEAVKSGNIFWNWNTDLGANFIGSYAFYLLGSPFFLIQLLLPSSLVPMAIPWVLCLKFAVSAVTAYLYLNLFLKNKNMVLLAALMYAFSSFSVYNIFFNHFNDAIALFPLLLYGLEEFMEKDRKGIFAAMVFLNAITNYYFFVAEVVFITIYFFFRLYHGAWPNFSLKKFVLLAFESAAGFAMALVIVAPAVLTTLQLPRADNKLSGWALITYYEIQRPMQILQAFFFPPEIPSQLNFFPDAGAKWSSVTAWLPMMGMVGVFTWIRRPKKDWIGRIIVALIIMCFIPPLNASFQLLSSSFYMRWLYMLVLMMALASAKALEECSSEEFKGGLLWTAVISAAIALPVGLIIDPKTDKPLAKYPERLWAYVGIVMFCLIATYLLIFVIRRRSKYFALTSLVILSIIIVGYGNFNITLGRFSGIGDPVAYVERNIKGREKFDLPDLDNIRIDVKDGEENSGIFWKIQTIQAFHSIVPGSIIEFYPLIGVERNVASRPKLDHIPVRSFLSVKYLFDGKNEELSYAGFNKISVQNGFGIWENKNYVPLGFTYDDYISLADWMEFSTSTRESLLLKAIVLDINEEKAYGKLFNKLDATFYPDESDDALASNCDDRREESAYYFSRDNLGFDSKIKVAEDTLAFYSVPYEPGWSATVNGKAVEIVRSNVGFMAVPVAAGDNVIRFNYMTPGLIPGLAMSFGALLLLLLYILAIPRFKKSTTYAAWLKNYNGNRKHYEGIGNEASEEADLNQEYADTSDLLTVEPDADDADADASTDQIAGQATEQAAPPAADADYAADADKETGAD
ncbi:MAG: YfhO family protein [Saccharofermentanales bacterium]